AVAEIIISRHFSSRGVKPTALAALAEVCSMRDVGCRAYKVTSVDDLYNPFVSMYFGAAYLAWLSEYEGRERSHEFIVQAYLGGPENVNLQETGPLWNKFQEALSNYGDSKKDVWSRIRIQARGYSLSSSLNVFYRVRLSLLKVIELI
ncbi:hypothetical protein ACMD2_26292, partial [Ananas comosus]